MTEKHERIPHNFGALPVNQSSWHNSRVVIVPVPYDLTSTYVTGSRRGPEAIIAASMNMELFDEEIENETSRIGIHTEGQLEQISASPERMLAAIEERVNEIASARKLPVMLGGEHSITIGALQALKKKHPHLSILQLDAHADLRDSYQGTKFSHACVGRRAAEAGTLVQAGIRSLSMEEQEFLNGSAIKQFPASEILREGRRPEEIVSNLGKELYITIDLDVFDPSVMPATGTPEPGGLGWYDVLKILRAACRERTVVGFDVVELCPIPYTIAPDFLAAKLVYRLIGYIFAGELKLKKAASG
jgi:agmatinase